MTVILNESDADLEALAGQRVAVVGYGNQGRSWALNLRDSGLDVVVCVRADPSRDTATADGFEAGEHSSVLFVAGVGLLTVRIAVMLGAHVR